MTRIPLKQLELGANVITVDAGGSADFDNVADAITAAGVGDTILIGPGTYDLTTDGQIAGKAGVTLQGSGAHSTILQSNSTSADAVNVNITGAFTLRDLRVERLLPTLSVSQQLVDVQGGDLLMERVDLDLRWAITGASGDWIGLYARTTGTVTCVDCKIYCIDTLANADTTGLRASSSGMVRLIDTHVEGTYRGVYTSNASADLELYRGSYICNPAAFGGLSLTLLNSCKLYGTAEITSVVDTGNKLQVFGLKLNDIQQKTSPVTADRLPLWDSADADEIKGVQVGDLLDNALVNDQDAIHDNVSGEINAVTTKATPVSGDLLLIEDSAAGNAKKKVTVGSLPAGAVDLSPYQARDTTGNQSITGTTATLNINSEVVANANYSLAADVVTVTAAGTYWVSYTLAYEITDTTGGIRGAVGIWLEDDSGGSFAETLGSRSYSYHRETSGQSGSASGFPVVLGAGDQVRLRVQRTNGTTNVDTIANYSQISMMKVA